MIIIYKSTTGNTKQYATMLAEELGIPAYNIDNVPAFQKGTDIIYFGWLFANKIVGYKDVKKSYKVKCVVGVGMTPESEEETAAVRKATKIRNKVAVFYLQGGFNINKLNGLLKLIMKFKSKEIIARYDGMTDQEKETHSVYRMITKGESVVSKAHLTPIIEYLNQI